MTASGPDVGPARAEAGGAARIAWIDTARGLGIVLVVIGHALGGLIDSRLGQGQTAFRQIFFAIYTFHMPLFFLLAGLHVERRLAPGPARFARHLLPTIVWPYFLWSLLQVSIIASLGALVNRPADNYLYSVLALPWHTQGQFWFLHTLFLVHLIAIALLRRIGREGFLLLGIAAKAAAMLLPVPPEARFIAINLLWYAIGIGLGPDGIERLIVRRAPLVRGVFLPGLAGLLIGFTLIRLPLFGADLPLGTATSPEIANLAWRLPAMAAAIAGVLAVIGLASLQSPLRALLAWLGRITMPIFLMHVLFIAGTRIVLIKLGLQAPLPILVVAIAAGLIGPVVVQAPFRSPSARRWLGFN